MESNYLRYNAVSYAKRYALSPNPAYRYFKLIGNNSGDCSNFISQCLHAGGCPMTYNKQNPWWYNGSSWSLSWAVANSLYWFLKINYSKKINSVKGYETENIGNLALGDLMFFEDYKGVIFHSAIVTDFSGGVPLISQHTPEALDIPYYNSWKAKKIHFMKILL